MDCEEFKFFLRGHSCNERKKKKLFRVFQHRKEIWNSICQRRMMFNAMDSLSAYNIFSSMDRIQQGLEPIGFILNRECDEIDYFKSTPLFWHEYSRYLFYTFTPTDAFEQLLEDEELTTDEEKKQHAEVTQNNTHDNTQDQLSEISTELPSEHQLSEASEDYEPPIEFEYKLTALGKLLLRREDLSGHSLPLHATAIPLGYHHVKPEDQNEIRVEYTQKIEFETPASQSSRYSSSRQPASPQRIFERFGDIIIANVVRLMMRAASVVTSMFIAVYFSSLSCAVLTEMWDVFLASNALSFAFSR